MTRHTFRTVVTWAVGVCFVLTTYAHACNVPVFRFALERWRPDPYVVAYLHQGPLSDDQRVHVNPLQDLQDKALANVSVQLVDVSKVTKEQNKGSDEQTASLPRLVLKYPDHLQIPKPAWNGAATEENRLRLVESPVRKELVKRLVDGDTAVWLFLESGDPAEDDAGVKLLEAELTRLEQDLKLPELTESPDDTLLTATPLRLKFSLLRISRSDPAEQIFVETLLHSEPDLADRSDPLVFPIFGRGRALFPLVGAGITKANIQEAATFLVGPCSCQVKESNPGFDLLLPADWEALLAIEGVQLTAISNEERATPKGEVELIAIPKGSAAQAKPAPVIINSKESQKIANDAHSQPTLNTAGVFFVTTLSIAAVVMGILLVLRR